MRALPFRPLIIACLTALLLAACATTEEDEGDLSAAQMYQRATRTVANGNWELAVKQLRRVQARYPFDPYAIQSHLDLINVHLEQNDPEAVVEEADRFVRENPRHAQVPYALFMKGMAYWEPEASRFTRWFGVDAAARDPSRAQRSFQYFRELALAHPGSEYSTDARQRMVHLQNRLARHELVVADYYMRRGAWVAAAQRARTVLQDFPESGSQAPALEIMVAAYRRIGLDDLAADAQRTLDANYPGYEPRLHIPAENASWWDWVKYYFSS
jgi:outer membrane protein assembly factor BamD